MKPGETFFRHLARLAALVTLLFAAHATLAQIAGTRVPGGCDVLASKRTAETGCYLLATESLKSLPANEVFWHLYAYPTRAAAEAARKGSAAGTVVESLGKIWLFTIAGPQLAAARRRSYRGDRSAAGGERQELHRSVHGSRVSAEAGHADRRSPALGARGVVRAHWRPVPAYA